MIYLGLRSAPHYLELLSEVRSADFPHSIVSVIGGLAFLQALGDNCTELFVADIDPDAAPYAELIISLIRKCDTGVAFFSLLTGYEPAQEWWKAKAFERRIDASKAARSILTDNGMYELYRNTYGKIVFNPTSGIGKIGNSTIHFFDFDLKPMNFNWQLGQGVFSDESSYRKLRRLLLALPIRIQTLGLDTLDYGSVVSHSSKYLFVLASNCDSPLFTSGDSILRSALRTTTVPARYMSWTRNLEFLPSTSRKEILLSRIRPLVEGIDLHCIGSPGAGIANQDLLAAKIVPLQDAEELRDKKPYNSHSILIWNTADLADGFLDTALQYATPLFRAIIIVSGHEASAIVQRCESLKDSYFVSCIEWAADHSIVALKLRGQSSENPVRL
jgi:hypothetical protein